VSISRLRMFAGPNGSGKSTLKGVVPTNLLGVYLASRNSGNRRRGRIFLGAPTSPSAGLMISQANEGVGRADEGHTHID
jgi:ABC-type uncharacterized transport system ATPase subunit